MKKQQINQWWNSLNRFQKQDLIDCYFLDKEFNALTPKDIQTIWESEHTL